MLRTLFGAAFTAAWITWVSGCTMPRQPGDLISRVTNSDHETDGEDEPDSRWTEESPRRESTTNASLASRESTTSTSQASYANHGTQQSPGLDTATLLLIESELRDAPAPERERWMAYLQTIDPKTVPYVLQARRMSVDATDSVPPGSQAAPASGLRQGQSPLVAASNVSQPTGDANAAMSQMRLNAPEPGGTSMVINPSGGLAQSQTPQPQRYVFNDRQVPAQTAQPTRQTQGALPRISPGTQERVSDPAMNDGAVMTTNFESAVDPQYPPVSSGQDAYLQEALQRVIALTEAEVATLNPGYTEQERMDYLRRQVALRMLYFMSEQPHLAQQAIANVSPADQEFWTELFWAVSDYFDVTTTPDPSDRTALAAAQLESAARHLQEQARLELWNTSFSHKITSFGNFERYDRDEFVAGQPVLLYAEVRNFHSEPTNSGHFRTQLKSHIEIRRGGVDGERIEYNSFPPTEDLCRAPRNDYFHSYKIELPHHLTAGPYALVLTVEDMLSGKVATQVLDFRIR